MIEDEERLRRLADRAEIQDVMLRYCRGIDRGEWDMIRACFHEDATDNHGPYRGNVDGLIDWISRRHVHIEQSMHFIGNCLIEFASRSAALVETYYVAFQRLGPEAEESRTMLLGADGGSNHVDMSVLGRYIDKFEQRSGHWKIATRVSLFEAVRTTPVTDASQNLDYNWHTRDRQDKLFEMQALVFGRASE